MLKYAILGIVQGLTEFFPVSSSGHLVILEKLFGITENQVAVSIVLHLGTVLALITFFYKDILKLFSNMRLLLLIIVVTFITGVIGVAGKDFFENLFVSTKAVALGLIFTGIILILTKKFMQAKRDNLNFKDAVILGLTQGIAIIPGVSRSGITISTLLFRGIDRETSFRFSFLVSIPAVFGAVLLEARKIIPACSIEIKNYAVGFIFSFLAGVFALWILKLILKKAKFYYFGYYCIIIAAIIILFKI